MKIAMMVAALIAGLGLALPLDHQPGNKARPDTSDHRLGAAERLEPDSGRAGADSLSRIVDPPDRPQPQG